MMRIFLYSVSCELPLFIFHLEFCFAFQVALLLWLWQPLLLTWMCMVMRVMASVLLAPSLILLFTTQLTWVNAHYYFFFISDELEISKYFFHH